MVRKIPPTIFQRFFRTETVGGSVLLLFGIAALALANSPLAEAYEHLWQIPMTMGIVHHSLSMTLHQWINEGLMAVFFLLVGLEIKRELLVGELASAKKAALPIVCAIGGMIVPAAIYLMFNMSGFGSRGWGIPVATDIAFALGALALIAPDAPIGAKVFLTALAIVDDMGAVLVIAIFYSHEIAWSSLAGAAAVVLVLVGFNVARIRQLWPYLLAGIALWYFVRQSGVHATVAGVILAFTIPTHTRINAVQFSRRTRGLVDQFDRDETGDFLVLSSKRQQEALFALKQASEGVTAPILKLETALHNFSAFVVMPLFAFANAGVKIGLSIEHEEITLGVLAGLVIGKPLGIMAAALVGVKSGIAKLPATLGWTPLLGYASLAGIGFTMSLFIAMLAFDGTASIDAAKQGILAGSLLAGVAGAVILKAASHSRDGQ
ncbi:MAG TPA: Na+/H+ antiporter NhaA [Candidatus Limnocylindria bacterium]|nr:Na+/H+ antiporter NhaA [Candidatus Limnocylindria bacterium]